MSRATDIYSGDSLRSNLFDKTVGSWPLSAKSTVEFTVDSVMMGRISLVERRRLRDGRESFGPEVNGQGAARNRIRYRGRPSARGQE